MIHVFSTRNIGVSNFNVDQLQAILDVAKTKPVANQVGSQLGLHSTTWMELSSYNASKILVHPYNYGAQIPVIEFGNKHGIVTEGYSPLASIRAYPGGPVDKPVDEIAMRSGCTPEQVLMAWAKFKDIVVITSSRDKARVDAFFGAGDIGEYDTFRAPPDMLCAAY